MSPLPSKRSFLAAGMTLCGFMAGLVGAELFLRSSCSERAMDIRRAYFAMARVWAEASRVLEGTMSAEDPNLLPRAVMPGLRIEQSICGMRHAFTTCAAPVSSVGYRSNGEPGEEVRKAFGLVLGDSFSEGAQVDDAETFTAVLSRLTGKRFVNLGVRAQGTIGHLERLEKSGFLSARPLVLIVQLHENDLLEDAWLGLGRDAWRRAQPNYFRRSGRWFYDLMVEKLGIKLWKHSILVYFLDHRFLRSRLMRSAPKNVPVSTVMGLGLVKERGNLDSFLRIARERRMKLVLLGERSYLASLKEGWAAASAPELSWIEADLPASGRIGGDVHWSVTGHAEIARRIKNALTENTHAKAFPNRNFGEAQ